MNLLKQIALAWIQYRAFQAAFAELSRLSDRELGELGLARGDIARVAFEEAERRTAARGPSHRAHARAAGGGGATARGRLPGSGAGGSRLGPAEAVASGSPTS